MLRCGYRCVSRAVITWRPLFASKGITPSLAKQATRTYAISDSARFDHQLDTDNWAALASLGSFALPASNERNNPKAWAPLLEACLPPQLRLHEYQSLNAGIQDGAEKGRVLYGARRRPTSSARGADLLCDLGVRQGRWQAVVWLVKSIVDALRPNPSNQKTTHPVPTIWDSKLSLEELTNDSIELDPSLPSQVHAPQPGFDMLDTSLNADASSTTTQKRDKLRRDALGTIWRSLGAMIIACADGPVNPEILEIIAYLHHSGFMPASIYSRKPRLDETAIQQPPTLHMLSARILTSLSDAAWKAHEKLILEQSKATGKGHLPLRPEIPGSAYRVHVSGLRAEIWLELILWSCLHGEWVQEGLAILESIYRQPHPQWKPTSWRLLLPDANDSLRNWDKIEYIFNTRAPGTMDQEPIIHDVKRTISSEVVNAYVDALVSELDAARDSRVVPTASAIIQLNAARAFLDRSDLKLGGGSWDAVLLRLFESRVGDVLGAGALQEILTLSPGFGAEVNSRNTQRLPPYVRDGSAAAIGIGHQVLRIQIKAGNLAGAFRVISMLQDYTDQNKKRSLQDFFRPRADGKKQRSMKGSPLFTGNYSMIDYPAFGLQIPSTTLGQLLELATSSNQLEHGKWLLYNDEVDGPLIPEHMYKDPAITPAIVRFATAAQDNALLAKAVQAKATLNQETGSGPILSNNILQSFFDVQVGMRRWPAAQRILEALCANSQVSWNTVNMAHVARAIIELQYESETAEDDLKKADLAAARQLFRSMLHPECAESQIRDLREPDKIQTLCTVFATVDVTWTNSADTIAPLPDHFVFSLHTKAFNIILQGVANARGATAAHRLLKTFWPDGVRDAHKRHSSSRPDRKHPDPLDHPNYHRTVLRTSATKDTSVAMYGGLRPNSATLGIVMRNALSEFSRTKAGVESASDQERTKSLLLRESKNTTTTQLTGIVVWTAQALIEIGRDGQDILNEVQSALSDQDIEQLRMYVPALFESLESGADDEAITPEV